MIKELVQSGRLIADRLILLDALNAHYEILLASNESDVTEDNNVLPAAMIWIHDRNHAAVVVAVQQREPEGGYLIDVLIRPYTLDAVGRRILCDPLPEDHSRCRRAAKEAALALAIHVTQRRLGGAIDQPKQRRIVDYTNCIPQRGDLSLLLSVSERVNGHSSPRGLLRQEVAANVDRGSIAAVGSISLDVAPDDPDPEDAV